VALDASTRTRTPQPLSRYWLQRVD
jgi:hypothetical protein